MSILPKTIVKIAKLHPDKVEFYQKLHDEIPELNKKHMQEAGIVSLRIFREGLTLFMIVESDPALAVQGRYIDQAAEARWHELTGECFSQIWEDADEIYTFVREEG